MKKILVFIVAATMLVACNKPSLKEQYQTLTKDTEALFKTIEDPEVADSVVNDYTAKALDMFLKNINEDYADTLLFDLYFMLSPEQKNQVFEAMPEKLMATEGIQALHANYLTEQATAAGNSYIDVQALQADGTPLALSSLVGKTPYLLVDFWASWCGPCRQLLPKLKAIYESQPAGKLQIVGISVDRDSAAWQQAIEEEQLPWIQLRDQHAEPYNPAETYGIIAIPTTFLIDSTGTIIARNPSEDEIINFINK